MKKIIYLTSEDWAFLTHRLPMALAAQKAGFEVHVATRCSGRENEIEAFGFKVHALNLNRGSLSLLAFLNEIREVRKLFSIEQPDIVHCIAVKPIIVGGIAGLCGAPTRFIHALTGLGSALMAKSLFSKILFAVLGFVLRRKKAISLFQNPDDRQTLNKYFKLKNTALIRGSGIDIDHYAELPQPEGIVKIGLVARMLKSKGIYVAVEASKILQSRNIPHQLLLAGTPDLYNPESLTLDELNALASETIKVLGNVKDVREVWKLCSIAILPQQVREGLPKALLEAASCGRAIVTSHVPGCREIVQEGVNGLMTAPKNPNDFAHLLEILIKDTTLRERMGKASRALVLSDLSAEAVGKEVVKLYHLP